MVRDYFPKAKDLLNIVQADDMFSDGVHPQPLFGKLQKEVQSELAKQASGQIEAVRDVIPAPLAVEAKTQRLILSNKF